MPGAIGGVVAAWRRGSTAGRGVATFLEAGGLGRRTRFFGLGVPDVVSAGVGSVAGRLAACNVFVRARVRLEMRPTAWMLVSEGDTPSVQAEAGHLAKESPAPSTKSPE